MTQGANTYTFKYTGLGDRRQQTVNGTPTTYTLDLNAGLTQVLADGANIYLYGNGRIYQQTGGSVAYFLGDALGSVRQLVSSAGNVTLAKNYEAYGTVLSSAGSGASMYGYTGEQTDNTGLVFLRARYYAPTQGRFIQHDAWPGNYQQPHTLNGWNYTEGNPVNHTDPSGHDPSWCDGRLDADVCYARWALGSGSKLDASTLKALIKKTYTTNPNTSLELLRLQFDIKLPPGYYFRFALSGFGLIDDPRTLGTNPWFYSDNWVENLPYIAEGNICYTVLTGDGVGEARIRHIDSSVYITDRAFTDYDFYPDDIAAVMIHEGTHAWQEKMAIEQIGEDAGTLEFRNKYRHGLERQAIEMMSIDSGRLHLSPEMKDTIRSYREDHKSGDDSPFVLPPGVP